MKLLVWSQLDTQARRAALARPALADADGLTDTVRAIIARVRAEGDGALRSLSAELDGVALDRFETSADEFDAAEAALTKTQKAAIEAAARNIASFHERQLPTAVDVETMPGVRCQRVYRPIARAGLYVPAGTAPLPSTALMLGIPARIAGCRQRILCSPPRPDGTADSAVLYAARIAGVERVFKLGGAQAIAAMAYGTESVPKADKIFGPGNTWVTEAKDQVARDPAGAARDYPAGPSEVLVIADASASPRFVAADLLSQAEHGADSQAILLATSRELATDVIAEVERLVPTLPRREVTSASLEHARAIVVDSLGDAIDIANEYAPEHLLLQVDSPRDWLDRVEAAGSVFLGPWSPESMGDYCSGTNHVLPTYGYARAYSSLGVGDFLRSMTVQELSAEGIRDLGPVAETLARLEGLEAHARAVTERLANLAGRTGQ